MDVLGAYSCRLKIGGTEGRVLGMEWGSGRGKGGLWVEKNWIYIGLLWEKYFSLFLGHLLNKIGWDK